MEAWHFFVRVIHVWLELTGGSSGSGTSTAVSGSEFGGASPSWWIVTGVASFPFLNSTSCSASCKSYKIDIYHFNFVYKVFRILKCHSVHVVMYVTLFLKGVGNLYENKTWKDFEKYNLSDIKNLSLSLSHSRERERKKTLYNIYMFICNNHFIVIYIIYKTILESRLSSSLLDKWRLYVIIRENDGRLKMSPFACLLSISNHILRFKLDFSEWIC